MVAVAVWGAAVILLPVGVGGAAAAGTGGAVVTGGAPGGTPAAAAGTSVGPAPAAEVREFVLSPEGNHLWAYDTATGAATLVVRAVNGSSDPPQSATSAERRDLNGQVCVHPDGRHVVLGEDTVSTADGAEGASSHDPRIAGWGYFRVDPTADGAPVLTQVGKLSPEAGRGPGYTGDPDNYGCGFLDDRRLLTTAIGDTLPGQPANGQLLLWFAPFDADYRTETTDGVSFQVGEVDHCSLDDTLATAGGIAVAGPDEVYVATNRPDDAGNPGAVWRYHGRFPSSFEECTPEFLAANLTKELVVPPVPLPDPHAPTPSAVVLSPAGTLVVSSVFSGTVAEYDTDGLWRRDLWPGSPVATPTGPNGDTPFGLVFSADGSLWIADLGIVGGAPAEGEGSVLRLRFHDGAPVLPAEVVADGLTFPDGLGVVSLEVPTPPPPPASPPTAPAAPPPALPATGGGLVVLGLCAIGLAARCRRR